MLESSPQEEIQQYCQGKFLSMAISRGMSFPLKRWCCATGAKFVTCLARIVIKPTQKDFSMPFTERSATPSWNPSPRQFDHSAEIVPCIESLQQPSAPTKDVVRGDHPGEVSHSDSDSESGTGSCFDSDSDN